jgi:hypothetical protein
MALEDSIAKIAADISDAFAEDVSRSIRKILAEENHYSYQELQVPTVRTDFGEVLLSLNSHTNVGQLPHPDS